MDNMHFPSDQAQGHDEFADFPEFPDVNEHESTGGAPDGQLEFPESGAASEFSEPPPPDWEPETAPVPYEPGPASNKFGGVSLPLDEFAQGAPVATEAADMEPIDATDAPVAAAKASRLRTPRQKGPVEGRLENATEPLDRLADYKRSYVARHLDVLDAEARASESLVQVLAAEERLAGGLKGLLERSELLVERAERAEAALTLAKDTLREQAQFIARAFKVQLTETEADGRATLLTHILEVGDRAGSVATKALNDAAEEAAAFAGVKAEGLALQRVTQTVIETAQASGLDDAVRVLVNASGRLNTAVERLEAAPIAHAAAPTSMAAQQATFGGLGMVPLAYMWTKHHLGAPGAFILAAGFAYAVYRFFSH